MLLAYTLTPCRRTQESYSHDFCVKVESKRVDKGMETMMWTAKVEGNIAKISNKGNRAGDGWHTVDHDEITILMDKGKVFGSIDRYDGHNWLPTEVWHLTRKGNVEYFDRLVKALVKALNGTLRTNVPEMFEESEMWDVVEDARNYYEPDPLESPWA